MTQGLIIGQSLKIRLLLYNLLSVPRPHSNNSKYWTIRPDHHLQLHSLKDWSHEISPPTPFHILLYFYCCSLVSWISHLFLLICPRWLQFYSFGSLHKPIHTLLSNMFTHIHLYPMIPRHLLPPSLLSYHTTEHRFLITIMLLNNWNIAMDIAPNYQVRVMNRSYASNQPLTRSYASHLPYYIFGYAQPSHTLTHSFSTTNIPTCTATPYHVVIHL